MPHRVLCIEGNEALRAKVRTFLERDGFAVDETSTGLEGMQRARAVPPDLVLADVHLPDIEGYEVAARLRQEKALQSVPFVAVGASPDEHDVAIAAGYDGVLGPDVDEHLSEELRAYIAGKRETLPDAGERAGLRALSSTLAARLEGAVGDAHRAHRELLEVVRLRSAFMNNLAHELSTPLTPLAGYLRILQGGKLGALSPQQQRIVDAMAQSVRKLSHVVDNLASFASLQTGSAPLLEDRFQPDALADGIVEELRPAIKEARLHVEVRRSGGGEVVADSRKLRQALANVVSNAVKFSPHGGEVLVEVSQESGRVRYAVYDQGPGIPPGEAERIFEPLYHAAVRGTIDARPPGSGLGLPVARRIVEAHGGRIWVESPPRTQPGNAARAYTGSKFVLDVPVHPAERPDAGPAPTASAQH